MTTTTVSTQRLARVFVEAADTLVDKFDLIEFLPVVNADLQDPRLGNARRPSTPTSSSPWPGANHPVTTTA
ncbi:hypothetical protein [Catellatospora tritici]|uniref:hypothetical protein n=1 Tax=Catellatospora tritici TaxID=2851566 RepID=UPI001C2D7086|nr:hypothetical protein [Catellatospora tritici]MBV1854399.1 hypothetical protein [Catellatospora tritici]